SLSSAGRSSWISEYVWIISRPQAGSITCARGAPRTSAAARHRIGRNRLPPAKTEWRMARCRFEGHAVSAGRSRSSVRSTSSRPSARYLATPCGPASVAFVIVVLRGAVRVRVERRGLPFALRLLEHDLDRLLDLAEL